jgi:hypothetical protein
VKCAKCGSKRVDVPTALARAAAARAGETSHGERGPISAMGFPKHMGGLGTGLRSIEPSHTRNSFLRLSARSGGPRAGEEPLVLQKATRRDAHRPHLKNFSG